MWVAPTVWALWIGVLPATRSVEVYSGARTGLRMRAMPAGGFVMGSPEDEPGHEPDESQRPVQVGAFWIAESEVTQAQYKRVMGTNPSENFVCGDTCPVDSVSWCDAVAFANAASKMDGLKAAYTGTCPAFTRISGANGYRLPSESEWEYAARAGQVAPYAGGEVVSSLAWYRENSGGRSHDVCSRQRNPWGLCDMSGNVWEWVWDAWEGDSAQRLGRGGSFGDGAAWVRAASRAHSAPTTRGSRTGFRVVCERPF